jgi:hypothetical protein
MKMRRTIWLTLAVAVNAILTTVSQASTNSCISSTDGFWDEARLWSLNKPPSIHQSAILITNAASETVTIDSTTATHFKSTLTISNLSVDASSGGTDTLYLNDTGTIALHILNDLVIGIALTNQSPGAAELISTNSTLIVDGLMGGQFEDDGTVVVMGGSLITTNCSLQVAPQSDAFYSPQGLLIISNAIVQARDVTIASASFSGARGTMEVSGGKMTCSGLGIGDSNGDGDGGYGTFLAADGCLLVVNGGIGIINGTMTVTNSSLLAGGVFLGSWKSIGNLVINNGTVNLSGGMEMGVGDVSGGSVSLNGGKLIVTNDVITMGGSGSGGGRFSVSDGIFLGLTFLPYGGGLSFQGGTSILSSNLWLPYFSSLNVGGGQLFVTNAPLWIDTTQCAVSGGLLAASTIQVGNFGPGILSLDAGSITVSTGVTVGNCAINSIGQINQSGGELIVTNAAHTGFIDVQDSQLVLSGGVLQVDKLVMTNGCSGFVHTGGTLIVGSVVLDPNAFQITSVAREGNDLRVTWLMAPGSTNALQVSSGGKHGAYNTRGFKDIFVVTNNTTAGTLTNYLDIGAATNFPSRYYRARLAP